MSSVSGSPERANQNTEGVFRFLADLEAPSSFLRLSMRVKNWEQFQHFKDRSPIWIKLYRKLLDDRQWYDLDPASSKLLINLWLLASEHHGEHPPIPDIAFRLRLPEKQVSSSITRLSHWLIQDDINVISDCHHVVISETETETETETDLCGDFDSFWNQYPRKIGKKAALKAWHAAKDKPDLPRILSALTAAKQSPDWTKENGKFIPHPATWLNQGRWDDVLTTPARKERLPL